MLNTKHTNGNYTSSLHPVLLLQLDTLSDIVNLESFFQLQTNR